MSDNIIQLSKEFYNYDNGDFSHIISDISSIFFNEAAGRQGAKNSNALYPISMPKPPVCHPAAFCFLFFSIVRNHLHAAIRQPLAYPLADNHIL